MKIRNETLLFSCLSLFEKTQKSTEWESMMKTVRCRRTTVIDTHKNLLVLPNGKWNDLMVRNKCAELLSISVNVPFLDHSRAETRQNSSVRCDTVCLYQFLQRRRTAISPFNLDSSRWLKMKRFSIHINDRRDKTASVKESLLCSHSTLIPLHNRWFQSIDWLLTVKMEQRTKMKIQRRDKNLHGIWCIVLRKQNKICTDWSCQLREHRGHDQTTIQRSFIDDTQSNVCALSFWHRSSSFMFSIHARKHRRLSTKGRINPNSRTSAVFLEKN